MNSILAQQRKLLDEKILVLSRLQEGLQWSLDRLPPSDSINMDDPAASERVSAIVDRFCKLQDQLAGAMRHAHAMLGEKNRSFQDVVTWAVAQRILPDQEAWLELRSLRNRLTHEYDLASNDLPELVAMIRQTTTILTETSTRFAGLSRQLGLTSG